VVVRLRLGAVRGEAEVDQHGAGVRDDVAGHAAGDADRR
jgi:hypothetical protein